MKQDDRWEKQYNAIMAFMQVNHRRPSKYKDNEILMSNWIKYNKKRLHRDLLSDERKEKFQVLLLTAAKYRRINQFAYVGGPVNIHNEE